MVRALALGLALSAAMVAAGGCSKGAAKTPKEAVGSKVAAAKTPREAVVNFAKSIEAGDKNLFLATVEFKEEDRAYMSEMFDSMMVMFDFGQKVEKAYGKGSGMSSSFPKSQDIDAKAKVTENGDRAVCKMEGQKSDMDLVRKGGAWKVQPPDMPAADKREKELKATRAMTQAIKGLMPKIGKISKEEFGKEFMGVIMKASAENGTNP